MLVDGWVQKSPWERGEREKKREGKVLKVHGKPRRGREGPVLAKLKIEPYENTCVNLALVTHIFWSNSRYSFYFKIL